MCGCFNTPPPHNAMRRYIRMYTVQRIHPMIALYSCLKKVQWMYAPYDGAPVDIQLNTISSCFHHVSIMLPSFPAPYPPLQLLCSSSPPYPRPIFHARVARRADRFVSCLALILLYIHVFNIGFSDKTLFASLWRTRGYFLSYKMSNNVKYERPSTIPSYQTAIHVRLSRYGCDQ